MENIVQEDYIISITIANLARKMHSMFSYTENNFPFFLRLK